MTKPTILFAMPRHAGMHAAIIRNLEYCGFEVIDIVPEQERFRYPNLSARLKVKFKQIILRQKDAKRKLQDSIMHGKYLAKASAGSKVIDYALFIRPDVYAAETLSALKQYVRPHHFTGYQWDGMNRFPLVRQVAGLFDRFFVFDAEDLADTQHSFLPATNFYFDYDLACPEDEQYDFYYIGAHSEDRLPWISRFCDYAAGQNWRLNFIVFADKADVLKRYPADSINGITKLLDLEENMAAAKKSRVLVDFVIGAHKGLSLRVFEALGYRKKLITTNREIVKYDFYHPDNIYVLIGDNLDGLPEFLARPYHEIDPAVREKYSFTNWIRYILDIEPHQKIRLPL